MEEKKLPEWSKVDTLPKTDACFFAIEDMFTLRQFTWDITGTRLSPWMVNLYRKIGAVIKTTLFPWWKLDAEYTAHQITPSEPKIRIDTIFRPKNDMFDLTLRYDKDVSKFVGVELGTLGLFREDRFKDDIVRNLENFWRLPLPFFQTSYMAPESIAYLLHNQILTSCAVTKENVRTYDNVTFPYTKDDDCWTLLTADGVENPLFAAFMKKEQRTERIALMMMVGNTRIDLIPINDKDFRVFIKGETGNKQGPFDLKNNDFIYVNDRKEVKPNVVDSDYIMRILRKEDIFTLELYPYIMLTTDGNSVVTIGAPQLRGRNVGICGDYNRNTFNELKDPKMCPLKTGEEMVKAWTLDTLECKTRVTKPSCDLPFKDKILY